MPKKTKEIENKIENIRPYYLRGIMVFLIK